MANIRKQFNFRNGVQVDDDNLVVSPTGLVGIGTTIPTEALDVRGTAKVVGLATVNQLFTPDLTATSASITNLTLGNSIIGGGVSIGSGIVTASGAGVVTYYGDGGRLLNLPTSQWLDVDAGLGFTSIYAQGYVGVGTVDPRFLFQVSGNANTTLAGFTGGLGISSEGNVLTTGIVTASKFAGIGSDLTGLNASNIAYGTISNDRIPVLLNSKMPADISVSGIVTATGGFVGNVTGNVTGNLTGTASTALSLNGTPNIVVGLVTSSNINAQHITSANINSSGIVTASSVSVTDVRTTNVNATGIVTSSEFNVGTGGTVFTVSSDGKIGIGSATPTQQIQIIEDGVATIESVGSESRLILAQEKSGVSIGSSAGVIRFGNSVDTFELLNYAPGNFNFYLHSGASGIDTGRFDWVYGQTFNELMSLTYDGKLGIGITNPEHNLYVVGTSTVTGDSYIGGNLTILGSLIGADITLPGIVTSNINTLTGVSTFNDIIVQNVAQINSIGIGTTNPVQAIDAQTSTALFSQVGLGTTSPRSVLDVVGQSLFDSVGIGTTTSSGDGLVIADKAVILKQNVVESESTTFILDSGSSVGVGTTVPRCAVDLSEAGLDILSGAFRYMLPPRLTTAERVGLTTIAGAFIFNTDTSKFQGYTGVAWTDFH